MYNKNQHADWLSLVEVSGPFLAEPVLKQVFPQDLEKLDPIKKTDFRQYYEVWRDDKDNKELDDGLHYGWINWVLKQGLVTCSLTSKF